MECLTISNYGAYLGKHSERLVVKYGTKENPERQKGTERLCRYCHAIEDVCVPTSDPIKMGLKGTSRAIALRL